MKKDPWKTLGLQPGASEEEIKKSFKKLALKHHPDKFTDIDDKKKHEEKFKEINEAYQLVMNPNKQQFSPNADNISDIFNDIFGRGGRFDPFGIGFRGDVPFGGIYNDPRQHDSQVFNIQLNADEIINSDKELFFIIDKAEPCSKCNGDPYKNKKTCEICSGKGIITESNRSGNSFFMRTSPCPECQGRGFKFDSVCDECKGRGIIVKNEKYKLRICKAEKIIN